MTAAVASGMPKRRSRKPPPPARRGVDRGEDVIVGVNKYRLASEDAPSTRSRSTTTRCATGRSRGSEGARDEPRRGAVPGRAAGADRRRASATATCSRSPSNAARARATLGEISAAMEAAFGRYGTAPTPVTGIYAEAYAERHALSRR